MRVALQAILRAADFNVSEPYDESGAQAVVRPPRE
jgi:hypothetical protein